MKYRYWLACLKGLGNRKKRQLAAYFGSAEDLFRAGEERILECRILLPQQKELICAERKSRDLKAELECFLAAGGFLVTTEDSGYPELLKQIPDHPYGLFFRGEVLEKGKMCPWEKRPAVAIVGARNCSAYGRKVSYELGYALGKAGCIVVSGMAKGIDGAAHLGCLDAGGMTIAVLGCGTDVCYPQEHSNLYQRIIREGVLMSEYTEGTQPLGRHFPARNRLISGLASQVIVVEAKEKSGSLITVDFALEQGKDIYVVPGRLTDPMSAGCNRLIDQGAGIICSVDDYLRRCIEKGERQVTVEKIKEKENFILEKEERLVYSCLDFYPKGLDQLQGETKLEILPLLAAVMRLCDLGLIQENFKNQYVRLG